MPSDPLPEPLSSALPVERFIDWSGYKWRARRVPGHHAVLAVLAVFAQRAHGRDDATAVLRDVLFRVVLRGVGVTVARPGIAGGFAAATGAALVTQALTAAAVRRRLGARVDGP